MNRLSQVLVSIISLIIGYFMGIAFHKILIDKDVQINQIKGNSLNYLLNQSLIFEYIDDECGEWGGNTETIEISRINYGPLIANYTYNKIDCEDPFKEKISTKQITRTLNNEGESLMINLINELIERKLNSEFIPAHSGIWNSISISDSTLIIIDYPSENLANFDSLKNVILNGN